MIEFLEKTEVKEMRNLSFNGTISSRELNHVIEKVSKMNCFPDDDHIPENDCNVRPNFQNLPD